MRSVPQDVAVYWIDLASIPKGITNRKKQIFRRFLWKGKHVQWNFSSMKWERIGKPKKCGGQGIKDLNMYAIALGAKLGQKIIILDILWKEVVYHKYIYPLTVMEWVRRLNRGKTGSSIIQKDIIHSISVMKRGLACHIRTGELAHLGIGAWQECGNTHILPLELRQTLALVDITQLSQISDGRNTTWL